MQNAFDAGRSGSRDVERKLLAIVFTLASAHDALTAISISHVSRSWRDVALRTYAVWSSVDAVLGADGAAAFVQRSDASRLDIHIHFEIVQNDAPNLIDSFLRCILPHAPRWRSLSMDLPLASWMDAALDGFAAGLTGAAVMLEFLHLRVNSNSEKFGYFARRAEGHRPVPLPFTAKQLVLDAVPAWQPNLFTPALTNLTLLNHRMPYAPGILAEYKNITIAPDLAELLELLQQCPRLHNLVISASAPTRTHRIGPQIVLPELGTASFNTIDALTLGAFFEHVSAPQLDALDLEWAGKAHVDVESFLVNLPIIAPRLTSLRIATVANISQQTWTAVFTGLRSLTHVTLEAIGTFSNAVPPLLEAPALSSLALVHIDDLTSEGLARVVQTRRSRHDLAALERLEVAWCEGVDGDDISALAELVRAIKWIDDGDFDISRAVDDMDLDDSGSEDSDEDDEDWDMDIQAELAMLKEFVLFPLFPETEEVLIWSLPCTEITKPIAMLSGISESCS
ncbi:hypothetical protein AURDEDRAFT_121544 [Auricularia subglabra TFB-10046 SS5]|nr:hypothetical protein AURDEDRAFT_121544 [Auricularia subglabra TFB-10046 SS5]